MEEKEKLVIVEYFSHPRRFADFMNATLFHGKQIVNGSELSQNENDVSYDCIEKIPCYEVVMEGKDKIYRIQFEDECQDMEKLKKSVFTNDMLRYVEQYAEHGYNVQDQDFLSQDFEPTSFRIKKVISMVLYCGEESMKHIHNQMTMDCPRMLKQWTKQWKLKVFDIFDIQIKNIKDEINESFVQKLQKSPNRKDITKAIQSVNIELDKFIFGYLNKDGKYEEIGECVVQVTRV